MKKIVFWMLPFLFLPVNALPATAVPQQNHAEIREIAAAFVRAQTSDFPGRVAIQVGEIDRRITLSACAEPQAFIPVGGKLLGNSLVGVRCPGKNGWTIFVQTKIKVDTSQLITNKPLQQGHMLLAEDVAFQRGELAQSGILTDPSEAIGKVLKYNIGAGQLLKHDMLRTPYVVTQGQLVQLHAEGAGFRIHSEGQALHNAAEGQSVQVRTPSGQVVSGMAQPDGVVTIVP